MEVKIYSDSGILGISSAQKGAEVIREAIASRGFANVILATGASQFSLLSQLVLETNIDWTQVHIFHLDEYIGLDDDHPASFRKYLRERFLDKVGLVASFTAVDGNAEDIGQELDRLDTLIAKHPIDVAFIGIGENGHLAFNDPPADFETERAYIEVELDDACRQQQFGEGWFSQFDEVPKQAISMSIRQIMKSRTLMVTVPDSRKAEAVKEAIEGPLTNDCPASILRTHPNCYVLLDAASSALLS